MVVGLFQSTLPRGSDPLPPAPPGATTSISIHAPSRERRSIHAPVFCLALISIHAPSRERQFAPAIGSADFGFQSTLPRGSDTSRTGSRNATRYFNPRSLAGATSTLPLLQVLIGFQSTLPRGSDLNFACSRLVFCLFQSTLPRGSDRAQAGLVR